MTLRVKVLAYLAVLHLALAAVAVAALWDRPRWLLAVEVLFVVSFVVGSGFARGFLAPLDLVRTGAELIRERDFGSRFRPTGQTEVDALVDVYNEMIDRLREERLRLEEQHLLMHRLLEASPSGILILDFDGRIEVANPGARELTGLTAEALTGRRPSELPAPFGPACGAVPVGGSAVMPWTGRRQVRVRRAEFMDRGHPRSFLLIDELTEELRATERAAYEQLIRMISHEVRNSVGSVGSLLETLHGAASDLAVGERDEVRAALDVARRRLEHLHVFVNGFADVVRMPAPERAPCDLGVLLADLHRLLRPELERRSIELDLAVAPDAPSVDADKNQLEQALVNLLRNAIEAVDRDGRVAVRLARHEGRRVELRIRDSGPGLAPGARERLFTPFFTTKPDGRGIGLTVVREVLERHGAEYELDDVPGGGAEFRMVL